MKLFLKCSDYKEYMTLNLTASAVTRVFEDSNGIEHKECVELPSGIATDKPIIMAFAFDSERERLGNFQDSLTPDTRLMSIYTFGKFSEFKEEWEKKVEKPDSIWYYVYVGERCMCSGACDPDDFSHI